VPEIRPAAMTTKIRFATPADASAVAEIYGPFCEDSPITFETERPSVGEIESRIRRIVERFPWLICENETEIIGYAYAGPHRDRAAYRWCVDVAIYLSGNCRGQGFGTALYTVLFQLLRIQGYFRAYAGITLPNPASIRLHQRLGFEPVGVYKRVGFKANAWHDVSWWALTLQPADRPPVEALPIRDALEREDFRALIQEANSLSGNAQLLRAVGS
jgi:L-amino acid N-acyltransferase YncA